MSLEDKSTLFPLLGQRSFFGLDIKGQQFVQKRENEGNQSFFPLKPTFVEIFPDVNLSTRLSFFPSNAVFSPLQFSYYPILSAFSEEGGSFQCFILSVRPLLCLLLGHWRNCWVLWKIWTSHKKVDQERTNKWELSDRFFSYCRGNREDSLQTSLERKIWQMERGFPFKRTSDCCIFS